MAIYKIGESGDVCFRHTFFSVNKFAVCIWTITLLCQTDSEHLRLAAILGFLAPNRKIGEASIDVKTDFGFL